jgi:hypothetical protein
MLKDGTGIGVGGAGGPAPCLRPFPPPLVALVRFGDEANVGETDRTEGSPGTPSRGAPPSPWVWRAMSRS